MGVNTMAKGTILIELKNTLPDLLDDNGNFRVTPKGETGKLNLSNNRIKLLQDLIRILRDTKLVSNATWMYVSNQYMTLKNVTEKLNEEAGKDIYTTSQIQSKVNYDKSKLERLFGVRFMAEVKHMKTADISGYERTIANLFMKLVDTDKYLSKINLNIPKKCYNTKLSDEEFDSFIRTISPYLVTQVKEIEDSFSTDADLIKAVGYFNYIITYPSLREVDKERLKYIKDILDV